MMSGSHTDQQQLANAGGSYIVTPINGVIQIPLSSAHHDVISATIEEIRRTKDGLFESELVWNFTNQNAAPPLKELEWSNPAGKQSQTVAVGIDLQAQKQIQQASPQPQVTSQQASPIGSMSIQYPGTGQGTPLQQPLESPSLAQQPNNQASLTEHLIRNISQSQQSPGRISPNQQLNSGTSPAQTPVNQLPSTQASLGQASPAQALRLSSSQPRQDEVQPLANETLPLANQIAQQLAFNQTLVTESQSHPQQQQVSELPQPLSQQSSQQTQAVYQSRSQPSTQPQQPFYQSEQAQQPPPASSSPTPLQQQQNPPNYQVHNRQSPTPAVSQPPQYLPASQAGSGQQQQQVSQSPEWQSPVLPPVQPPVQAVVQLPANPPSYTSKEQLRNESLTKRNPWLSQSSQNSQEQVPQSPTPPTPPTLWMCTSCKKAREPSPQRSPASPTPQQTPREPVPPRSPASPTPQLTPMQSVAHRSPSPTPQQMPSCDVSVQALPSPLQLREQPLSIMPPPSPTIAFRKSPTTPSSANALPQSPLTPSSVNALPQSPLAPSSVNALPQSPLTPSSVNALPQSPLTPSSVNALPQSPLTPSSVNALPQSPLAPSSVNALPQSPVRSSVNSLSKSKGQSPIRSLAQSPTRSVAYSPAQSPVISSINALLQSQAASPINASRQSPAPTPINTPTQQTSISSAVNAACQSPLIGSAAQPGNSPLQQTPPLMAANEIPIDMTSIIFVDSNGQPIRIPAVYKSAPPVQHIRPPAVQRSDMMTSPMEPGIDSLLKSNEASLIDNLRAASSKEYADKTCALIDIADLTRALSRDTQVAAAAALEAASGAQQTPLMYSALPPGYTTNQMASQLPTSQEINNQILLAQKLAAQQEQTPAVPVNSKTSGDQVTKKISAEQQAPAVAVDKKPSDDAAPAAATIRHPVAFTVNMEPAPAATAPATPAPEQTLSPKRAGHRFKRGRAGKKNKGKANKAATARPVTPTGSSTSPQRQSARASDSYRRATTDQCGCRDRSLSSSAPSCNNSMISMCSCQSRSPSHQRQTTCQNRTCAMKRSRSCDCATSRQQSASCERRINSCDRAPSNTQRSLSGNQRSSMTSAKPSDICFGVQGSCPNSRRSPSYEIACGRTSQSNTSCTAAACVNTVTKGNTCCNKCGLKNDSSYCDKCMPNTANCCDPSCPNANTCNQVCQNVTCPNVCARYTGRSQSVGCGRQGCIYTSKPCCGRRTCDGQGQAGYELPCVAYTNRVTFQECQRRVDNCCCDVGVLPCGCPAEKADLEKDVNFQQRSQSESSIAGGMSTGAAAGVHRSKSPCPVVRWSTYAKDAVASITMEHVTVFAAGAAVMGIYVAGKHHLNPVPFRISMA